MLVAPIAPLVQGRAGRIFFVLWSAASTAGILLFYWLDGGGRSPIAFGLVLALAFAGFLYPCRARRRSRAFVIGGYPLAALPGPYGPADVAFVITSLACASGFCVRGAGWRDRQRGELRRAGWPRTRRMVRARTTSSATRTLVYAETAARAARAPARP